jgi:MFS family permease
VAASGGKLAMLYAALYTIAAGAGGLKANVSGFGSDQFDARDPREERAMMFFFNRFYFCISLGSLFAVTVLVYVQDNVGRGWGYGVSAAAMVAAVALLAAGKRRYRYRKPQGSPLTVIGRVLWAAWRNRRLPCPADASELRGFQKAKMPHTDRLRYCSFLWPGSLLSICVIELTSENVRRILMSFCYHRPAEKMFVSILVLF